MTPADTVRVGVVGVGAMGRHHARLYAEAPDCRLVGVHDTDAARAEAVAMAHEVDAVASLQGLLEQVDAVSVAVPTPVHHPVGLVCLEAGCDVLVEKPLASDLKQADELVAAADAAGRVLLVGHVERYNPAVEALVDRVDRPGFIEVDRLGSFVARSLETDVILDLMIHDIDVVGSFVGGPIREIRAVGVPILSEELDIANARIEYRRGCIVNLTASRVSASKVRKVRVFQPQAYLSVDYTAQTVKHYRLVEDAGVSRSIEADHVPVEADEPLAREIADFLHCVRSRSRPRVDGAAGRRALETALRIRDALRVPSR